MTSIRQRKKDKDDDAVVVEPMDEDDQDKLIQSLHMDAIEQNEFFHSLFARVCELAIVLCLVVGLTGNQVLLWVHVGLTSFLHLEAIATSKITTATTTTTDTRYMLTIVVVVVICSGIYTNLQIEKKEIGVADPMEHWGLVGSNLLTFIGAAYLRYDASSTLQKLSDLDNSKYHYKSL